MRRAAFALFLAACAGADRTPGAARPNIIIILADDMGYSDIGCAGGEIRTPALDRLAGDGLRFTRFYNTARCCPTRASLLTGLYPHQAGVGHMTEDRGHDGYRGELNRRCATIAEVLRPAGYGTYAAGKWHVSRHPRPEGPKDQWPLQRGFDRFYGTIGGGGNYFDPATLTRDNTMISSAADPEYRPERYYYTDALADHAVRFIGDHRRASPGRPFFLYLAFTAAHWPMHAPQEDVARGRGRYAAGYESVRRARLERMRAMGLVPPDWTPASNPHDWAAVPNPAWESRCMEVYAAMVERMDRGIGRVTAELERTGSLQNTLIFYLQDNGGCAETIGRDPQPEGPASYPPIAADAVRLEVRPKQTRDGRPVLGGPKVMPGPDDSFIAYGPGWATVSNTPFREYKHWVHEGGISTPLIAHWPTGIRRRGGLEHRPGHLVDLMATCVDVAGADYPSSVQPMEGFSLVPAFEGRAPERPAPIFWEHEGNRAIRHGRWKLVAKEDRPWELYDIEADRTEQHDLAAAQPERARELEALWNAWAARANVLPLGTWRGAGPRKKRFELKAGADLSKEEAPGVADRPLTITVEVSAWAADGVLVAQGGSTHGFSLYVSGGKPAFAVRRGNALSVVAARDPVAGARRIVARLAADGSVTIRADDRDAASGTVAGLLTAMPADGLQVGRDAGGAVGPYAAPFEFGGRIESAVVEVE